MWQRGDERCRQEVGLQTGQIPRRQQILDKIWQWMKIGPQTGGRLFEFRITFSALCLAAELAN